MLNRLIFPALLVAAVLGAYYFSSITLPFLIAAGIAYVFQPIVGYLECAHFPRWLGSLTVILCLLTILGIFFLYSAPILYLQLTKLIIQMPDYIVKLQTFIHNSINLVNDQIPSEYSAQIQKGIQSISKDFLGWGLSKTQFAFQGGLTIIHYVMLILFVPVFSFYLMKDWDKLLDTITYYIPPQNKKVFIQQSQKIDCALTSFARGQALVCIILMLYYGAALHILGLDFGGLIGGLTGLFAFIPYVGSILGFITSATIAFVQTSAWLFGDTGSFTFMGAVTLVFAFGQFLEGIILSPNIVGKSINLHPLWIMFSLFLGGYLFGFAGILIATPAAGAIAVIVRYALIQYRNKMHALYHEHVKQRKSYAKKP